MSRKTALITGASSGLGKLMAEHLVTKGYKVFGTSRNPKDLDNGVVMLQLDLSEQSSIDKLAQKFSEGVDILINNAGQSQLGAFEDIPDEAYYQLFEINFFGTLRLTRALLPAIRKKENGLIINTSSLIASFPLPYYSSYVTSKAALSSWSFSLNMELRKLGIHVVVIEPNDLNTSIEPQLFVDENKPYATIVKSMREKVRQNMSSSENPRVIIKTLDHILVSKIPKPKYVIGGNSGMLIFLKRFLTSATQLNLTMRSYKE